MGAGLTARLVRGGHRVVGYDRDPQARRAADAAGAATVAGAEGLVAALAPPRIVWIMVPAGAPTEQALDEIAPLLDPGDTVVDGGNTYWRDDLRRASTLAARGLEYLDVGVSGGLQGREHGYCLMVGGARSAVERLAPLFAALAAPGGWLHVGPVGSGHFVKMVHNGIEYGLMQAYAEGFELMAASGLDLDLAAIARLWGHGSVVRSWLLELIAEVLAANPTLADVRPWVEDSGEGRWTVQEAVERAVPAPALTAALYARFRSRREASFADRLLAVLRQTFGGHPVRR
jgi:6-phosphogluconate dehydrogenase